jgi:hypothetical protein
MLDFKNKGIGAVLEDKKVLLLEREKPFLIQNGKLETVTYAHYTSLFSALVIPVQFLYTHLLKLPKSVTDDEIAIQAEIQFFKEGGLNPDKEYVIDYIKHDIGDEYLIDLFAVEKAVFQSYIDSFSYKVKAVDEAFPRFITYEVLYLDAIEANNIELIYHLSDKEAYATLFYKGRYIGHRSISSIEVIAKKVGIEQSKVKELLETNGLLQENYTLDDMLFYNEILAVVSKDIEKIVYFVNHRRRFFGFDGVDTIRIDLNTKDCPGLGELFANFGLESHAIALFENLELEIEASFYLPFAYATAIANGNETLSRLNLTTLPRKKPLYKYEVVHFGIFLFAIVVLLGGVSLYMQEQQRSYQEQLRMIKKEYKQSQQKYEKLVKILKKLQREHIVLKKERAKKEDELFVLESSYNILPLAKELGHSRQKFMNDLLFELKRYHLNVSKIEQKKDKEVKIVVISLSKNRSAIAKFMQAMLAKGYRFVTTSQIVLEDGVYKSLIRIQK